MPIPPPQGINLNLAEATPSALDAASLKTQLENIGLNCSQLTPEFLQAQVNEVTSQMPTGSAQAFAILAPAGMVTTESLPASLAAVRASKAAALQATAPVGSLLAAMGASEEVAIGNWTELDSAQGYRANLEVIQYLSHFNWLMEQQESNAFPGIVDNPPAYQGDYPNADAIRTMFVNTARTAASTVVAGIDQSTMQAVFSNVIQPLTDSNLSNYDQSGSRAIMLAENYNQTTKYAEAIGVVSVSWRLQIQDYQRKSKDGGDTHHTVLTISSRSALYSDVSLLCRHYNSVLTQFGIDPAQAPTCRS